MTVTLEAWFDGEVFRPEEPINLAPNTHVRITIETDKDGSANPYSFLDVARKIAVNGPSDMSTNLDDYLYGSMTPDES